VVDWLRFAIFSSSDYRLAEVNIVKLFGRIFDAIAAICEFFPAPVILFSKGHFSRRDPVAPASFDEV
jgi:hypothetical protein